MRKDILLEEFICNNEMHLKAIEHAKMKGYKESELYLFSHPETWETLGGMIARREYKTSPTRICYIDKITGNPLDYETAVVERELKEVREIFVMNTVDRVVWNMLYQICYKHFAYHIHWSCKSYKQKESTRTVAKELSGRLAKINRYKGYKHDLSKYFDTVPLPVIEKLLAKMQREKPSCIWEVICDFYYDNRVIVNGEITERYGALKQGCAFACLLANLVLADVDAEMCKYNVIYYRYSDDLILIGKDSLKADIILKKRLSELGLKLNEKKTEILRSDQWFTFLGFRYRGGQVTISEKSLKNLRHKIKSETIFKCKEQHRALTKKELKKAIDNIQYYFFTGCEKCNAGMAVYLFGAINVEEDIYNIDEFIKDCIRASYTNKCEIYGIGSSYGKKTGTIRGKGRNTGMNNMKAYDLPRELGWYSLNHMYKKFHSGKGAYNAEILKMKNGIIIEPEEIYC